MDTSSIPLEPQLLSEHVATQLRRQIASGEFAPGARLRETAIASVLGISKTPVREAIRQLEREGLVVVLPRRGATVKSLSLQDVREITEVRLALESLAVVLGHRYVDAQWYQDLDLAADRMAAAESAEEMAHHHAVFHEVLVSRCQNRRLLEILAHLGGQVRVLLSLMQTLYENADLMAQDHRRLIQALREGSQEEIEIALREHLLDGAEALESEWRDRAPASTGEGGEEH
jgi:DNA-binding GntR family transcriptional regulator